MKLCIQCEYRPIRYKQLELCSACYQEVRAETMPNYGLCSRCGERPVRHIKRRLCHRCYQILWWAGGLTAPVMLMETPDDPTPYGKEMKFIKNFFTHSEWKHQPATFKINGKKYCPDFYDGERNVFIEVSGSRQAYHANKDKYRLFRELFPLISFEIRKTDGSILDENNDRLDWS